MVLLPAPPLIALFSFSFAAPLSLVFHGFWPGVPWALGLCGPPPGSPLPFFFLCLPAPPPFFCGAPAFSWIPLFFSAPACFCFCLGVPVLWCMGRFMCPGLWGVLVCVAVRVVPRRGPVCAFALSLGAPWLCSFCVCCCLLFCGVVVCFVFCPVVRGVRVLGLVLAPCCWPLLPSPGLLLWSWLCSVLRCGAALLWCAACRVVCCCLHCVLVVVPSCFVRTGWCCVLLPVVAGCSLLGLVARRCFSLVCVVAGAPAWPGGLLPCCVLWLVVVPRSPVLCPTFRGPVLASGAVLWRPAVCFSLLVVLCLFPVCAVLCCAARRVVRCRFDPGCCWCLLLWCVAVCCGISLGVLWCGGAALVCRGVLLCRAVCCGAASPCGAVPLGCAVFFPLLRVFFFSLKTIFRFLKIKKNQKIK